MRSLKHLTVSRPIYSNSDTKNFKIDTGVPDPMAMVFSFLLILLPFEDLHSPLLKDIIEVHTKETQSRTM